jgi:hypothetical protein
MSMTESTATSDTEDATYGLIHTAPDRTSIQCDLPGEPVRTVDPLHRHASSTTSLTSCTIVWTREIGEQIIVFFRTFKEAAKIVFS